MEEVDERNRALDEVCEGNVAIAQKNDDVQCGDSR